MKTYYYRLVILFVLSTAFNSCTKDENVITELSAPANEHFGSSITLNVIGRVLDENGQPIYGATVKCGYNSTSTDKMGVFFLKSINAYQMLGTVIIEKEGYYKGVRSFYPKSGGNELSIVLLSKSINGSFNSNDGGTVSASGVSVTIDPNSVQLNNTPYNGVVNVAIKHINPESPNFKSEMPGSLVGIDSANSYGLFSFGMMAIELTNSNGQKLQIESGKMAEIRITVPASLLSNAPSTIPLWSLDETLGVWKKESTASLINNVYVGNVGHFSFWNADLSYDYIYLSGKFLDSQTHNPLTGCFVTLTDISNSNSYSDDINSSGWIGGMVPKNKALQLTVNRICSGAKIILYDTLIGPFATNLNLDSILVNTSQLVLTRISGSITDCNNNLIKASYVMINGNDIIYANNGFYSTVVCDNSVVINAGFPVQTSSTQLINLNGSSQVVNFQICPQFNTGTMSDFDGNLYKTITIGNQTWMAENLRTEHFKLGGHIATSLNNYNWNTTTAPAYTSWNNDTTGDYVYGKLYNWYAVIDSSGLCPVGWRVPNDSDWTVLIDGLGGNFIAGGFLKEAGYSHWDYPNVGANNISGFNALPSGVRNDAGTYAGRQSLSLWWSTSERAVKTSKDNVETDLSAWDRRWGMSVRCIKN